MSGRASPNAWAPTLRSLILAHDLLGRALRYDSPLSEKDCMRAERADRLHAMRHDHQSSAASDHILHPTRALLHELSISDTHELVDDQDLRLDSRSYRESKPSPHSVRVGSHGKVNGVAKPGETHNLPIALPKLLQAKAEEHPVQEDIVSSRQVVLEASAQLQQRRYATVDPDVAGGRLQDLCQHETESRFPRPVGSNDAKRGPSLQGKAHLLQSPDSDEFVPPQERLEERFSQALALGAVDAIADGYVSQIDDVLRPHSWVTRPPSKRRKTQ